MKYKIPLTDYEFESFVLNIEKSPRSLQEILDSQPNSSDSLRLYKKIKMEEKDEPRV